MSVRPTDSLCGKMRVLSCLLLHHLLAWERFPDICFVMQMIDADRQDVLSFLSANSHYASASGEIVGILKQMHDEMSAGDP